MCNVPGLIEARSHKSQNLYTGDFKDSSTQRTSKSSKIVLYSVKLVYLAFLWQVSSVNFVSTSPYKENKSKTVVVMIYYISMPIYK